MGLNVKIYNIISNGNYTIRYKSGNNPYPVETNSTFTLLGSYTPSTTEVTISGLTFDTQYWIKMTDNTTGRYIVQNIYTHDSKAFPCYDTICFSIDVTCEEVVTPTPTPTYTQTVTPTRTPTRTPTLTPEMCAAPTLNSVTFVSGSTVSVSFVSGPNCVSTEIGYSVDNVNWVNNTGTCTSPRLIELSGSTGTYHIRIKKNCNGMSSSYVYEDFTFPTPTPTPTRTPTRTPTPTLTRTPTLTPTVGPLSMVGKTSADANDGLTACTNYSSVRGYHAAPGKTLSTLTYGDTIYLSYPSIVENGGGKWVALKTGGVGPSVAFQIASNGEILDVYTC